MNILKAGIFLSYTNSEMWIKTVVMLLLYFVPYYYASHLSNHVFGITAISRIFSWFIGRLNYQIEHHLFTGICHVHYPRIAPIVKATAEAFGSPYHVQPTFLKALAEHGKMLKVLGKI